MCEGERRVKEGCERDVRGVRGCDEREALEEDDGDGGGGEQLQV